MPPPRKTNPEQTIWLKDRLSAFRQAQRDSETGPWGLLMCQQWYAEWPIEDEIWGPGNWPATPWSPEDMEKKEKACIAKQKQLISWFRNNARSTSVQKPASAPVGPKGKGKRALQEVELYSKLYYNEKVKRTVEEELANLKAVRNVTSIEPDERLKIVREQTKASLRQESDSVKALLAEAHAEEKERARALAQAYKTGSVEEEGRMPAQYQHAIDTAPGDIRRALDPIAAASGCIYTVVLSGPMPVDGGAIGSLSVHSGTTVTGHNFGDVTPHYREEFVRPHVRFAKGIFPVDVRQQRALPPASTGLSCSDRPVASASEPSTTPVSSQMSTRVPSRQPSLEAHVIATPSVILEERDKHTGLGTLSPLKETSIKPSECTSSLPQVGVPGEGASLVPNLASFVPDLSWQGGIDTFTGNTWSAVMPSGTAMGAGWGPMYNMSGAQLSFGNAPMPFSFDMSGPQLSFGNQLASINMSGAPTDFAFNELFTGLGPLMPMATDAAGASIGPNAEAPPPASVLARPPSVLSGLPTPTGAVAHTELQPAAPYVPQLVLPEVIAPTQPPTVTPTQPVSPIATEPPAPVSAPASTESPAQPETEAVITTRTGRVSRARPAADGSYPTRPGVTQKPKPRPVKKGNATANENSEAPATKKQKSC
ncbi:hypothetical protein C8T65DRAFT_741809 [Cerioporus squamosus]|nr:hypothetical protein C8T65DRAFT_741809 [Cerioporus squamosus]